MFDVSIDTKYIVTDGGTSDGTQIKYYHDGYWYKLDRYGGESTAERIGYLIAKNSSLNDHEYVEYEQGFVNGMGACRCHSFLQPLESFITFYRLYYNIYGKNIAEVLSNKEPEERAEYVIKFLMDSTGLDIKRYLANTFAIDRLLLNEDRHYNNLGIIVGDSGYRAAPIFDNGKSLLVGNVSCMRFDSIEEKAKKVIARPFSGSHDWQYEYFKNYTDITFDVKGILKDVNELPPSKEKEIALYQIKKIMWIL